MLSTVSLFIALLGYLLATGLLIRSVRTTSLSINYAAIAALLASLAHAYYAYSISVVNGLLNVSLSSMLVLSSAIVVWLYLLACLLMPIKRLGLLVYPSLLACLLIALMWPSSSHTTLVNNTLGAHILISLLAYSVLTIATVQALLYVYQERKIKQRIKPTMLLALPPLQTMESLLFQLIAVGFLFLSLTLLSGALFSQQLFGNALAFNHHTILAVMGWAVFAGVLIQRRTRALRGSPAAIWTLLGFSLIQLGYFGTKFVTESLS